ncbi:MAG: hypothetical protein AAF654_07325 [Myxococcota bacterium]
MIVSLVATLLVAPAVRTIDLRIDPCVREADLVLSVLRATYPAERLQPDDDPIQIEVRCDGTDVLIEAAGSATRRIPTLELLTRGVGRTVALNVVESVREVERMLPVPEEAGPALPAPVVETEQSATVQVRLGVLTVLERRPERQALGGYAAVSVSAAESPWFLLLSGQIAANDTTVGPGSARTFYSYSDLGFGRVFALFSSAQIRVWVGAGLGLIRIRGQESAALSGPSATTNLFAFDANGGGAIDVALTSSTALTVSSVVRYRARDAGALGDVIFEFEPWFSTVSAGVAYAF